MSAVVVFIWGLYSVGLLGFLLSKAVPLLNSASGRCIRVPVRKIEPKPFVPFGRITDTVFLKPIAIVHILASCVVPAKLEDFSRRILDFGYVREIVFAG